MFKYLAHIRDAMGTKKILRPRKYPPDLPMALDDPLKELINKQSNNHTSNDLSFNEHSFSSSSLDSPPLIRQSVYPPIIAGPSKPQLNYIQNDDLDWPLTHDLPLASLVELEDEEFADDMALHESPILQPPANSPAPQSFHDSLSGSTIAAPYAEMEDDYVEEDDFQDSVDHNVIHSMDLGRALEDCERAIKLFFNNQLGSALAIMTPWKETSLYHAHGATILEFIPAALTLEPTQIQRARDALDHTLTLCAQLRRSYTLVQSLGSIIKTPNYGGYSEKEAHSELVHAEAGLLSACLLIIENEDMTGLVRASLRVKGSYDDYRTCAKILAGKTWKDNASRAHFESGVRLGLATFNVMIAMLPPRLITLLQFIGFSADKAKGLKELSKAAKSSGLRSVLCELTLLVYYLVIGHFAAIPPDFNAAEKIISKSLKTYPDSVWFLMFKARTQLLRGKTVDSIETYQTTCRMRDLWPQMKHLAYWELVWAFAMLRQWTNAAEYAAFLEHESKWSRTIYMYAQAAMLIQNAPHSPDERKCIDGLLSNAPSFRQRLLGRSLPMEKFVLHRCERWAKRGYLILPGVEWLYLWNIFPALAADNIHGDLVLKVIEKTCNCIKKSLAEKEKNKKAKNVKPPVKDVTDTIEYDEDDLALAEFLRGSLLTAMAVPRQGIQHLENVLKMKDKIQEHKFLLPYATVEMASCHYKLGDPERAVALLQDARKKYSSYLLEARLHFRIHSKLEYMRAGVDEVPKKSTEEIAITGADIIAARKSKKEPKKSTNDETSSHSNGKSEQDSTTNSNNSSATYTTRCSDPKENGTSVQKSKRDVTHGLQASVTVNPEPGPSSAKNVGPPLRLNMRKLDPTSIVNRPHSSTSSMPSSSSKPGTSVFTEPMPSTSLAASNVIHVLETPICKPGTSETHPELPSTSGMGRTYVNRNVPSTEMDLITPADPKSSTIENARVCIEDSKEEKSS